MDVYPDTAHDGKLRHWFRLLGHRLRITGRFNDPSALGCEVDDVAPSDIHPVAACRNRFVAIQITDLGKP
jgi:hypothetical protein